MAINKRRLAAIARWLEAGAPERKGVAGFDMCGGIVFNSCGTTCCIAGAAVSFFGDPSKMRHNSNEVSWGDVSTEACAILGLPEVSFDQPSAVSYNLFYTSGGSMMRSQITPVWAARTIRHLIKTGKVDWEGCRNE